MENALPLKVRLQVQLKAGSVVGLHEIDELSRDEAEFPYLGFRFENGVYLYRVTSVHPFTLSRHHNGSLQVRAF